MFWAPDHARWSAFSVVGIMPAGFQVVAKSDAWTVLNTSFMRSSAGVAHFLRVIGRLAPGTTREQAQADMDGVAAVIERERPDMNLDRGITIEPLQEALVGRELRLTSFLLLGVVGFVLLMCCGTSRTCCSRGQQRGGVSWRYGRRWARGGIESFDSC